MNDIPTARTIDQVESLSAAECRIFYDSGSGHEYGVVHNGLLGAV
jgi:hypothetical protein